MNKMRTLFLALLLISAVVVSGCLGRQGTETPTAPGTPPTSSAASGVSGDIPTVAPGTGMAVETPASASDESVDLGTLI